MNLLLYTNITPNKDKTHYLFSSFSDYKTALSSNLFKTVVLTDYRITSGIIKVKIDETLTLANYKNVTYAINENDNMCYLINSSVVISGFVIYECDVDYWGSYIANADISHINVLRCNRNVDTGIYETIENTQNKTIENYYKLYDKTEIVVAFSICYTNDKPSLFGNQSTTTFEMYGAILKDLVVASPAINDLPIERAIQKISGIFEIYINNKNIKANVVKCWLVPREFLFMAYNATQFNALTINGNITLYAKRIKPNNFETFLSNYPISISPNYKYYIGTLENNYELKRKTINIIPSIKCNVSQNEINIYIGEGDNLKNITTAFEVTTTTNNGNMTVQEGIAKGITTLSSIVGGVGQMLASPIGLFTGPLQIGSAIANTLAPKSQGGQNNGGDGITTFSISGDNQMIETDTIVYPFRIIKYESQRNEEINARQKGAYYDCYVSTLANIFNYSFIGTGTNNDDTFVKANLCVANIPTQAINEIIAKFKNGVYLKKL